MTTRILTLFLICLYVSATWAQSSEIKKPVPPITKETKGASKPNANGKQTITVEFPPSINITMGGKLEVKTENEETKRNDESPNFAEWLIAFFTGLLVFVTGWLVFYTKNLWGSTQKLAWDAKATATQQAADMQNSLSISKQSAEAAMKAANAAETSVDLSKQEFIATHRPKLIVRSFSKEHGEGENSIIVRYDIVNMGYSPATVVKSSITWLRHNLGEQLPSVPPYAQSINQSIFIESGISHTLTPQPIDGFDLDSGFAQERRRMGGDAAESTNHLFALGYIDYKDAVGRLRRTAFLREFIFADGTFRTFPHPDYEYQD